MVYSMHQTKTLLLGWDRGSVKEKTHTYENKVRQIVKSSHILIKNGKPYVYLIHS